MRSLLGFICVLLLTISVSLAIFVADTETNADRWIARATALEQVEQLNMDILRSQEYSAQLLEATKSLALENGLLCERDAKMVQVVAEFEEENRALKNSLAEAVQLLESQTVEINTLIDENSAVTYRNQVLLRQISSLEGAIQTLEQAISVLQDRLEPTPTPAPAPEEEMEVSDAVS